MGITLVLTLRDSVSGLEIQLVYSVFENSDVITHHARFTNGGSMTSASTGLPP